jgi:heat shock protein HspQ
MKELSIEEKAKAYDNALKVLHKYDGANIMFSQSLKEEMFPELAESEDKKMMNQLHSWMKEFGGAEEYTEKVYQWIKGLLEKQGEQNHDDKVEPKFKVGDIITNGILIGEIDEIHEWGYHAYFGDHYADVPDVENWHKWTIQDAKANAGYEGNANKKELKKVEQKSTIIPKFKVGDIIRHKEQGFTCKIIAVDTEYRLSECSGTHLPFDSQDAYELVEQKPAEWTKEDKERYISCLQKLSTGNPEQPETINSKWFKEHVYPKPQWKPSDKQIYSLDRVLSFYGKGTVIYDFVKELLEQLKKL